MRADMKNLLQRGLLLPEDKVNTLCVLLTRAARLCECVRARATVCACACVWEGAGAYIVVDETSRITRMLTSGPIRQRMRH